MIRGKPSGTMQWVAWMADWARAQGKQPDALVREVPRWRGFFMKHFHDAFGEVPLTDIYDVVLWVEDAYIESLVALCLEIQQQVQLAERRRQGAMADAFDRPFALLDAEGRVTLANADLALVLGTAPEALAGRVFMDFCGEEAAAEVRRALRQRGGTGTRQFVGNLLGARNTPAPMAFSAHPMFDADGRRDGVALAMRDLSRANEMPMPEQVAVFEQISLALRAGFELIAADGTVQYTSESARRLTGITGETPLIATLIREDGARDPGQLLCELFEQGQFWQQTMRREVRGETRWLEVMLAPQHAPNGVVTRVLGIVHDITQQRYLESRIMEQQRSSLASQLAVTVAHQLRNPLGVMIGYAEMLAGGMTPDQVEDAIERMMRSGLRCKKIVEDLLEFGRGMPGPRVTVEINQFLRETVLPLVDTSGGRIHWNFGAAPGHVKCVPQQLSQVILSLLDNALRNGEAAVEVSSEVLSDRVRVRVLDDGPGIAPEHRARVFEPFFTTHKESGAVGLGLSLAQYAVQDFGGRIYLDEEHLPGAAFVVELPRQEKVPAAGRDAGPETGTGRRRLLVVDDETDLLELLRTALAVEGFEVHTAVTAVEALHLLERNAYDGAVLDVQLPGELSGPQLFQYLRGACPDVVRHTLFITADTMNFETRKFLDESGRPSMEKPFLVSQLVRRVVRLFGD
jgi:PAS domain S-box-containing protein